MCMRKFETRVLLRPTRVVLRRLPVLWDAIPGSLVGLKRTFATLYNARSQKITILLITPIRSSDFIYPSLFVCSERRIIYKQFAPLVTHVLALKITHSQNKLICVSDSEFLDILSLDSLL